MNDGELLQLKYGDRIFLINSDEHGVYVVGSTRDTSLRSQLNVDVIEMREIDGS